MSYFAEQQKEWWEGGIFIYAIDKQIKVEVDDIPEPPTEKQLEKLYRRIYKKLGLRYGSIPADYDPYNQNVNT